MKATSPDPPELAHRRRGCDGSSPKLAKDKNGNKTRSEKRRDINKFGRPRETPTSIQQQIGHSWKVPLVVAARAAYFHYDTGVTGFISAL